MGGEVSVCRSSLRTDPTNSEADTLIIDPKAYRADMQKSDPSHEPNRPHISSVTSDFKEPRNKTDRSAVDLSGAPACTVPLVVSAMAFGAKPVKGYLRIAAGGRKGFFQNDDFFSSSPEVPTKYGVYNTVSFNTD